MARWVGVVTQQPLVGFEPTTSRLQVRHRTTRPPRTHRMIFYEIFIFFVFGHSFSLHVKLLCHIMVFVFWLLLLPHTFCLLIQAFKMPGDELPKTPPKSPDKQKPDDVGHITHKAKKLEVKEPVSARVSASLSQVWCHCRISPPRFRAECDKWRLNQGSFFCFAVFCVVCFLSVFVYFPALFCSSVSVKCLALKSSASEMT